jgi:hypothetical protein
MERPSGSGSSSGLPSPSGSSGLDRKQ